MRGYDELYKRVALALALMGCLLFAASQTATAQAPAPPAAPRGPFQFTPDPRVQERSYHFDATNEELKYSIFVSSKVDPRKKAPLVMTLHGLGVGHAFMPRGPALDLAEEGGYILVSPEGYNPRGWYGIPRSGRFAGPPPRPPTPPSQPGQPPAAAPPPGTPFGPQPNDPPNLRELSEKDVMNVLAIVRKEFNVDDNRIYLMGHSMGGAGTLHLAVKYPDIWAAIGPIAPAAFELDPESLAKVPNLPVVLVHGDADEAVPVALARRWAEVMKSHNMTYEYHELPGISHGPVINAAQPLVYAFFAEHSKEPQRHRRRSRAGD